MKKLLLFIVVLFGSMSAMSLAAGCAAQVCVQEADMLPQGSIVLSAMTNQ